MSWRNRATDSTTTDSPDNSSLDGYEREQVRRIFTALEVGQERCCGWIQLSLLSDGIEHLRHPLRAARFRHASEIERVDPMRFTDHIVLAKKRIKALAPRAVNWLLGLIRAAGLIQQQGIADRPVRL